MELPVNTGGVGGGDYPFKADVMDAFLRDSLHVAKSTVTTEVIGKLKRTDDAAASEPHLAFAERANKATVNSKPPDGAKASNARGGGFKAHPEVVQLSEKLSQYAAAGRRRADDMAASVATSSRTTGTNAAFWKQQQKLNKSRGAPSVAATDYPETAVTSRVDTVVMRETLERLEKLEAHLHEEKLRRAATEQQLKHLKGLVDSTPALAAETAETAAAAAPKPKRTASARAAAPKATVTTTTAVGGGSPVSAAASPAAVQQPRARLNSSRSGRPAMGSVAAQLDDPFSRSWLRR